MTPDAILRDVGRIYSNIQSVSYLFLAGALTEEFRLCGIMNALSKTVVLAHLIQMQVLYADDPIRIDARTTCLMREMLSTPGYPFMDTRYNFRIADALIAAFPFEKMIASLIRRKKALIARSSQTAKFGNTWEWTHFRERRSCCWTSHVTTVVIQVSSGVITPLLT